MIRHGEPPFLECSSKGERRLSAFWARPSVLGGLSIEEAYHAMKVFDDGSTGLTWWQAKSARRQDRTVVNMEECLAAYSLMWDEYVRENPELLELIRSAAGLSDVFGQPGHACQATELWRIRNR